MSLPSYQLLYTAETRKPPQWVAVCGSAFTEAGTIRAPYAVGVLMPLLP